MNNSSSSNHMNMTTNMVSEIRDLIHQNKALI